MVKKDDVHITWLILKYTFGIVVIVTGVDKFFNIITNWESYLSPTIATMLPFSASTFMSISGIIEIVMGILVLTKLTKIGAYIVSVWLVLISLNLIILGAYDIAIRDLVMAVGAYSLARLSE